MEKANKDQSVDLFPRTRQKSDINSEQLSHVECVCLLHDRAMHLSEAFAQSAKALNSKCNNCTLEEVMILTAIAQNPQITQKELAKVIGKSERTMKSRTVEIGADCKRKW